MSVTFKVVVPVYNFWPWIERCLDSIATQDYPHFEVCVLDDCSTDPRVWEFIAPYCEAKGWLAVRNEKNVGALANRCKGIELLGAKGDDVVIEVDGDDWFFSNTAFSRIAQAYETQDAWMTYGQIVYWSNCRIGPGMEYPPTIKQQRDYRKFPVFALCQPRTYKAFLYEQVHQEDLKDAQGNFFRASGDCANLFPLAELAGDHLVFIPDVLYVYNDDHGSNDSTLYYQEQKQVNQLLRAYPKYPVAQHPVCL